MSETRRAARRYFDAWTSGDGDTVAAFMAFAGGGVGAQGGEGRP
jgi:hypothetical protein